MKKILLAVLLGTGAIGAALAQDDPFAGGEDTIVEPAPEAPAVEDPPAGEPGTPPTPAAGGDAAGGAATAPAAPLPPADPAVAGDSMIFHPDLKQFEFDVTVNAYQAVNDALNAQSFARKHGARGAIYPPVLTPQQVEAEIEQEVQRRIQIEYPDSRYEEIKREAAEDFKMWKVGDRILVHARRGDKMVAFSGLLEFVTRTRIKVSNFPLYKDDLGKEYLPRLYRVEHERAVQRQVTRETRIFNGKRQEYGEAQRKELTARSWYAAGYIRGKQGWIARSEVFEQRYQAARSKEFERVFKANREKVYLDNGWVFDPTLNRWLSPEEQKAAAAVATATVEDAGTDPEPPATNGGIFDTVKNLLNKEDGGNGAPPAEDDLDIWDDEPKKNDEAAPETPPAEEEKPGEPPADDSDLFGE